MPKSGITPLVWPKTRFTRTFSLVGGIFGLARRWSSYDLVAEIMLARAHFGRQPERRAFSLTRPGLAKLGVRSTYNGCSGTGILWDASMAMPQPQNVQIPAFRARYDDLNQHTVNGMGSETVTRLGMDESMTELIVAWTQPVSKLLHSTEAFPRRYQCME